MQIKVASCLSPFSHDCGERFLFPETAVTLQVFPTRLVLQEESGESKIIDFSWKGFVREFTAKLDLERRELTVFGFAKEGYFSYRILRKELSLVLIVDKVPASIQATFPSSVPLPLEKKGEIPLIDLHRIKTGVTKNRLSLGSHKAQEFSKIKKRCDPAELIPLWIQMGALCPDSNSDEKEGPFALLLDLKTAIIEKRKQEIWKKALLFFQASFHGIFVPRLIDEQHQGLFEGEAKGSSLPLLTYSATLLSSLFYSQNEQTIEILPLLLPELHSGRWIDISLQKGITLHFEWRKNRLRQMLITSTHDQEVSLLLPKGISSCRITRSKGMVKKMQIDGGCLILSLEGGKRVSLDRFFN